METKFFFLLLFSGDFNKYPLTNILSANGALKQVVSVATKKSAVLEVILTDLATLYHPPTTYKPYKLPLDPALLHFLLCCGQADIPGQFAYPGGGHCVQQHQVV